MGSKNDHLLDNGQRLFGQRVFYVMGTFWQQTAISESVANLSPTFGAESVVFVRLSAPSLEGEPIFPRDQIGFADRGLNTWLPRQIMLPEPIHRLLPLTPYGARCQFSETLRTWALVRPRTAHRSVR
jgi:hypothetical protein